MLVQKRQVIEETMDFIYGYLILKSYFFSLKTGLVNGAEYPNGEYTGRWKKFLSRADYDAMLEEAFNKIRCAVDGSSLDIYDTFDRASYFALIHPNHPNITLGFIKDADLWDIWLHEAPFSLVRETVAEILSLSNGDRVIDFGCGSVSPVYYGSLVGPNGVYAGVDYSKPLVSTAELRAKEQRLDWVKLKHAQVETRLIIRRPYDYVICTSLLQYVESISAVLRNAGEALGYDGVMLIFSELFKDVESEKYDLMSLYYSLIPSFKDFPSVSGILETLDSMGVDYGYKMIGKNFLKIEFRGK